MDPAKAAPETLVEGLGLTIWLEPENGPHPWLFDENGKQRPATGKNSSWVDPKSREDDPWAMSYSTSKDTKRQEFKSKLDAIAAGKMSLAESGLPEPNWDARGEPGDGYQYMTKVRAAVLSYERHKKRETDKADQEAYLAQREKEAEEVKAEVEREKQAAEEEMKKAAEEAANAQAEALRLMEEMQKKHGF